MKKSLFYIALMVSIGGLLGCEKESDGVNTNGGGDCEALYTLTTSATPPGSGVINFNDKLYCRGDSVLCTAVPSLYYEFVDWEQGNLSSHSPLGNSGYFYIFENSSVSASFRVIDTSYISSSLNVLAGFSCNPQLYPACQVKVTNKSVTIGSGDEYKGKFTAQVELADLGVIGLKSVGTYKASDYHTGGSDHIFNIYIKPNGSDGDTYSLFYNSSVWPNQGSVTVNLISHKLNMVDLTFNNLVLTNSDGESITFFGSIRAAGI